VAATVNWDGLRDLATFHAEKGCAISLYLDLDPSTTPTAGDVATRINSLLNEGESRVERATDLTHEQREALRADLQRVRTFLEQDFDRDGVRGAAVFSAGLDNFWRPLGLNDPVADRIRIARDFHLAPLVPLVGRGDGVLIAAVSRERGSVYRLRGGVAEEVLDQFDEQPSRHDQGGWSQARFQRHIDELAAKHLRDVGEQLERLVRRSPDAHVVVVCRDDMRSELEAAMSNELRSAVVGWANAEAHATPPELVEAAEPVVEEWRARQEAEAAERWREEAGRNGRAASGWSETLEAASDARVELLLFQEGADRPAWQCASCGRVSADGGACPLDGTQMEERDDGLDLAVHQTVANGGTVLALRHQHDLEPVEGIGALLRF
jgi:peptide chain release factor subunit 1